MDDKSTPNTDEQYWSIGTLAKEFGVSVWKIDYVLDSRKIPHVMMAGNARLFDVKAREDVAAALKDVVQNKTGYRSRKIVCQKCGHVQSPVKVSDGATPAPSPVG